MPPGCEVGVKATSEVEKFLEGATLYSAHLKIRGPVRRILARVAADARVGDSGNVFLVFENAFPPNAY